MLKAPLMAAGAAQRLIQGSRYEDPPQSAATFKQMLQQRYGANCPDFLETSWQDAAVQAHRQYKFLFVYLHSTDHEVTHGFKMYAPQHNGGKYAVLLCHLHALLVTVPPHCCERKTTPTDKQPSFITGISSVSKPSCFMQCSAWACNQ